MNPKQNILVCVTQQKTCERLIRKAAEMKEKSNGELFVIHVAKNEWNFLDNIKEGEALEYLFAISKSVGAALTVLKSDNIVDAIRAFVVDNKISCIVMGQSPDDHKENAFHNKLRKLFGDIEIHVMPQS